MNIWDACAFPVNAESLLGKPCFGGLDLSSTTDITALVLVFPPTADCDKYQVLPYFWLPEDNIELRVRRDHVPYDIWLNQGLFNVTEGNVIHYEYIQNFIDRLQKKYDIREIAYDRWGSSQMVQELENLGLTVVPHGQGFKDMSQPTKDLMRLVLSKQIAHGGKAIVAPSLCCGGWWIMFRFRPTAAAVKPEPGWQQSALTMPGISSRVKLRAMKRLTALLGS
jgi:phage terminase large subunit-like protein